MIKYQLDCSHGRLEAKQQPQFIRSVIGHLFCIKSTSSPPHHVELLSWVNIWGLLILIRGTFRIWNTPSSCPSLLWKQEVLTYPAASLFTAAIKTQSWAPGRWTDKFYWTHNREGKFPDLRRTLDPAKENVFKKLYSVELISKDYGLRVSNPTW